MLFSSGGLLLLTSLTCASLAYAGPKPLNLTAIDVPRDSTTRVGSMWNCMGLTPPQFEGGRARNGKLVARAITTDVCGRTTDAVGVFYTPAPGFTGADFVEWFGHVPGGGNTTLVMSRTVNVK